ncbi:MAG: hypothetical protein R3E76_11965 [Planctomycetota bacterium]
MAGLLDSADWHVESAAEAEGSPFAPAGFIVAWLAERGLLSDQVFSEFRVDIAKCISRTAPPLDLYAGMDGKLSGGDIRPQFVPLVRDTLLATVSNMDDIYSSADSWDVYAALKFDFDALYTKWLGEELR